MQENNKGYIDIFKFIFSICIIAIHTDCFIMFEKFNWYITHMVFRLAVPFFFVCSGYFYTKKVLNNYIDIKNITRSYIKKLTIPFFFWLLVGLIISEYKNTFQNNILYTIYLLFKKIVFYPWGALWYILALIVSIFILSKFYSKKRFIEPVIVGFILYLFALVCNSYYFVINNCFLKEIVNKYMNIFISARNGLFVGLLFTSVGGLLYKISIKRNEPRIVQESFLFLFFFILLFIEVTIVRKNIFLDDSSLFLTLPILSFLLVSILLKIKTNRSYLNLRKMSIILYLVHRPILAIFTNYYSFQPGLKSFTYTFLISFLLGVVLIKVNNKYINKLIMI